MSVDYVFQRIEKKYMLTEAQYRQMLAKITPYVEKDQFAKTTICNLYFDTEDSLLIRRSIQKPVYKEKLRLRSYGVPKQNSIVFLEIKKKCKGIVNKRRIALPLAEAEAYLKGQKQLERDNQILHEIEYFMRYYHPEPKLFLAYDREAYKGKTESGLRITFDHNIRARKDDLDLAQGSYGEPLSTQPYYLMEIKTATAMPLWLVGALSELAIYPTSFSKYGSFYKKEVEKCLTVS